LPVCFSLKSLIASQALMFGLPLIPCPDRKSASRTRPNPIFRNKAFTLKLIASQGMTFSSQVITEEDKQNIFGPETLHN
tara:strand:+ start:439 stop:675 length:237 start_codon:yes stop_codon:yes gene_type:complete